MKNVEALEEFWWDGSHWPEGRQESVDDPVADLLVRKDWVKVLLPEEPKPEPKKLKDVPEPQGPKAAKPEKPAPKPADEPKE
jgi:hypothetical protein